VVLEVSDIKDNAPAHGHLGLPLTDTIRLVIRKSTYIEPATIGTIGSKPPAGLKEKRNLAERLRDRADRLFRRSQA
jgi:hypothetical protein